MLPATHAAAAVGIDLAAALAAARAGRAWEGPRELPAGSRSRMALFPQEWYRDPESPWLRTLASDAPWDDPDLLTAMVALARAAEDSELRFAAAGGS